MKKKLTIIIPHYNSPHMLDEQLSSIFSECDPDETQVIVVDDKSDKEREYFKTLQEKYPKAVFYPNTLELKGIGVARNIGLSKADSVWILFADADDLMAEGWYEKVKKHFTDTADMIFFPPAGFIDETYEPSKRGLQFAERVRKYLEDPCSYNEDRLRFRTDVVMSKMIRLEMIRKNAIDFEDILHWEDRLFSAKCGLYAETITADPAVIYRLREWPWSVTGRKSEEDLYQKCVEECIWYRYMKAHLSAERFGQLKPAYHVWRTFRISSACFSCKTKCRVIALFVKFRIPFYPMFATLKKKLKKGKNDR